MVIAALLLGVGDAQTIFLVLLSIAYQRRASGDLLAGLPTAARHLEDAVARNLEALADSTRTGPARQAADLDAALAAVESALVSAPHRSPADEAAVAVERRLALYQTLVRLVSQLDLWQTDRPGVKVASGR